MTKESSNDGSVAVQSVVVYHAGCPDGLCAAWTAWKKLGNTATYFPLHSDSEIPDQLEGKDLYLLDIAWPLEVLEKVDKIAKSVVVLDHHKTAAENLAGTEFAKNIRQDWSGAHIAWQYFHGQPTSLPVDPFIPTIVRYIEDNDLWLHKMPDWESAKIVIEQMDLKATDVFQQWDQLAVRIQDPEGLQKIVADGRACVEYQRSLIARLTKDPPLTILDGHEVPCVNSSLWQSEIGDVLDKGHPFAVVWRMINNGSFAYSLRSDKKHGLDVAAIAQKFGGGGHRNAAGFTSNSPPMLISKK